MDGGFFLCPDVWEFLLPAEICHLRNAMAVCQKRWDLLTLTPMGCALLPEPAAVTAGILLLPGDCPRSDLRAGTVVTYGLSPRDSITLSSLREPVLCVQRALPLACGGVLESEGGTITVHGCAEHLHAPEGILHGHNDHRVVMSLAVLSAAAGLPLTVDDAEAIQKSWPNFFAAIRPLGVEVEYA